MVQRANVRSRLYCIIIEVLALVHLLSIYSGSKQTHSFKIASAFSQDEYREEGNRQLRGVSSESAAKSSDDDDDNAQGEAAVLHPSFSQGRIDDASFAMHSRDASGSSSIGPVDSTGDVHFSEELQDRRPKRRAPWQRARDSHRDAIASLEAMRLEKMKRRQGYANVDEENENNGSVFSSSNGDSTDASAGDEGSGSIQSGDDNSNEEGDASQEDVVTEYSTSNYERKRHSGKRSGKAMMRVGKYAKHRKKLRGSSAFAGAEAAYNNAPEPIARPLSYTGAGGNADVPFGAQASSSSSLGAYDVSRTSGIPSILSNSAASIPNGGIGLGGFTSMEFQT